VPFVHLRTSPLHGWNAVAKRLFDVGFSAALLAALAPVLLLLAAAVRLTSRGPVLYQQERMGLDGQRFSMLKFRTMRVDAEVVSGPVWAQADDGRRTPIGTLLRRFSLDELPQFWNVLVGEMSIVGPRPLPANQVAANPELLSPRHVVPAGVTGWWQTNGRSRVTPEEALRLDLFYIENWSLTLDLYVVLKTFSAVVGRQGAY
jgi:lipopolysaccharide/colanic/teichoic acid biosynthesis glycosyltransferase